MKATQLLESIDLLVDYRLYSEARTLVRRARADQPRLFGPGGWNDLEKRIPNKGKSKGYKFTRVKCRECGKEIAENWIIRHLKSGCKTGNPQEDEA